MKKKTAVLLITLLMIAVFCCVKGKDVVHFFSNDIPGSSVDYPEASDKTVYFDPDDKQP